MRKKAMSDLHPQRKRPLNNSNPMTYRYVSLRAPLLAGACLVLVFALYAQAGSATWNLRPTSGDWNTAANWTPATVPNGPSDTATFATSNKADVSLSADVEVSSIVFGVGASAYTITAPAQRLLAISGTGVQNNSGVVQHFVADQDPLNANGGSIDFTNNATAGSATAYTVVGGQGVY